MKKNLLWVLIPIFSLVFFVPNMIMTASAKNKTVDCENLSEIIGKKAELLINSSKAISVQYALIDNGKITVSGQAGKNDDKLTKDTLYGIGSVSKVFGAVAVMKLVEEGKIDLDTPVYKYISDFKMKDDRYKQITPRMLLNHSSGLRGTESANDSLFEDNDTYVHDTLLKTLSEQTLKADPGAFSVYCNSGFTLAEILVERVSGMSFTQFIHKYFTEPLQMNHTNTPQDKINNKNFAGFYVNDREGRILTDYCNAIASGGINSTAEDMVRFSQLFMGYENNILSYKSVKDMEKEEYKRGIWSEDADDSSNYGLGWDSVKLYPFNDYGIKALAKGGDLSTYSASLVVLPEKKMAAVVLTAGGSSGADQLLASKMLLLALKEKGEIKDIKDNKSFGKPVKAKMPDELIKKAGYYANSEKQSLVKITKNGQLSISDDPKMKYIYTSDGTFMDKDGTCKLSFVNEKNGRLYLWKRIYENVPGLGQSAMSEYIAEKLEANSMPEGIAEVWKKREGVKFYILNNKFTADAYLFSYPAIKINLTDGMPGYWEDRKIIDSNTATSQIQIPGLAGRDTTEAKFYTKNGIEYLKMSEYLYVSENSVKPIDIKNQSNVKIAVNGNAKWYTIPSEAAGKTMIVDMPASSAFAVYNEQEVCVNYSLISGKNKTILPVNGTIVFAGQPQSEFKISIE